MKKVFALIMALVLCAVSFAAVAETVSSPVAATTVDVASFAVSDELSDAAMDMAAVIAAGDSALTYFDDETAAAIAAIVGEDVEVKEAVMLCANDAPVADTPVTFSFETAYAEGETVAVAVGFTETNDWTILEGTGTADGAVAVTLGADLVAKLNAAPALVYVLSAK